MTPTISDELGVLADDPITGGEGRGVTVDATGSSLPTSVGSDDDELLEGGTAEDDLLAPAAIAVTLGYNSGQVAGVVHGGLHQHFDRVRDYHELTERHVNRLLSTFVEPGYRRADGRVLNSSDAASLLRLYGGTVLVGAPDTGRRTAALRLLSDTGRPLREIRAFDPARDEQLSITALPVHAGVAYLLELPEKAQHVSPGFARDLAAHGEALLRIGSCVVVTASEHVWPQLGPEADGPVLHVGTPPAGKVLGRQLHELFPELDLSWLPGHPAIVSILRLAGPADAVRLARLAKDVIGMSGSPGREELSGPDQPASKEVLESLVSAFRNWEAELHTWFGQHRTPRPRLFLVAAAALPGATPGRVLWAAEQLGARLGDDPPAGLAEDGVRALMEEVGACLDQSGRVRFRRPRYGDAVLDFVVSDRSEDFQRELWRWAARLPLNGTGVDRSLTGGIAELLLRTALRRQAPRILATVMPVWARRAELRGTLVEVLGLAALSPEIGTAIRRQLYRWAIAQNHPAVLSTVAQVCGGELADFYVDQALVRLGQLARWGQPEVDEAVLAAVRSIWGRPPLRTAVLFRLARWLAGPPGPRVALAGRALELVGRPPVPGAGPVGQGAVEPDPGVGLVQPLLVGEAIDGPPTGPLPEDLIDHVLVLLRDAPPPLLSAIGSAIGDAVAHPGELSQSISLLVGRWCDAAAGHEQRSRLVVRLLTGAVGDDPAAARRVARIRRLLQEWQPLDLDHERPERAALRNHLVKELHRADPSLGRHARPLDRSKSGAV